MGRPWWLVLLQNGWDLRLGCVNVTASEIMTTPVHFSRSPSLYHVYLCPRRWLPCCSSFVRRCKHSHVKGLERSVPCGMREDRALMTGYLLVTSGWRQVSALIQNCCLANVASTPTYRYTSTWSLKPACPTMCISEVKYSSEDTFTRTSYRCNNDRCDQIYTNIVGV